MNNQTLEKLRQMRLFGMHDAFKTSLENTIKEKMTQDQFVSHLVHSEWDNRKNRAVERAVRAAQFRYNATLDDVDYTFERGLDRNQVERLAAMEFVRDHKDLIITGPTGTGKSYLATALGYKACQDGFRVMYASTAKLMSQLKISKAKGTILADLKRIERVDLMILDDFCMQVADKVTDIDPKATSSNYLTALGIEKGTLTPSVAAGNSQARIGTITVRYN